ncbi:hypothetical protein NLU13_5494 [Sarocladium strictum]|uniref:Polyketide cyclase/dehydrase n=1 Tax=Sarocladium strictum TaxID=5046 RepID=A0AA39L798_SARSR|nr:hypothetical protein NLU13_5494 [Sarocladium strictum]
MSTSPVPLHQDPQCGPSIATPDYGHGVFTVSCSTVISAPPQKCLDIVLDGSAYPDWNTFCTAVTIDHVPSPPDASWADAPPELQHLLTQDSALFPGVDFKFDCVMKEGAAPTKTALHVSRLEVLHRGGHAGYRVAWTMRGSPHFVLRTERVQEFIPTEDGSETEYYCYETFGGILAYVVRLAVGSQVADGFGRWMTGLKEKAERA